MGIPSARDATDRSRQGDRRPSGHPLGGDPPSAPAEIAADAAAVATLADRASGRAGGPRDLISTRAETPGPPLDEGRTAPRIAAPLEPTSAPSEQQVVPSLLRQFRTQVRDLRALLDRVPGNTTALDDYADYIQKAVDVGDDLLTKAEIAAAKTAGHQDELRHIRNTWEQLKLSPLLKNPARNDMAPQDQLQHVAMLDACCREIDFQIGWLTIPERLNGWLAQARPGYYVPFHAVFADELPNPEDRAKVLSFLAWSPEALRGGLVDASTGLVYRFDQDRRRQWLSLLGIVGVVVLATTLVILACYPRTGIDLGIFLLQVDAWPFVPDHLSTLLVGWAAVLAGVVVHVAVGTAKLMRSEAASLPVIAATDLLPRVNAKFGTILLKLLLALIGFFGLVFAVDIDQVTLLTAFLIGYSLDSVVELFGTSLENRALAQTTGLRTAIGVPASS